MANPSTRPAQQQLPHPCPFLSRLGLELGSPPQTHPPPPPSLVTGAANGKPLHATCPAAATRHAPGPSLRASPADQLAHTFPHLPAASARRLRVALVQRGAQRKCGAWRKCGGGCGGVAARVAGHAGVGYQQPGAAAPRSGYNGGGYDRGGHRGGHRGGYRGGDGGAGGGAGALRSGGGDGGGIAVWRHRFAGHAAAAAGRGCGSRCGRRCGVGALPCIPGGGGTGAAAPLCGDRLPCSWY